MCFLRAETRRDFLHLVAGQEEEFGRAGRGVIRQTSRQNCVHYATMHIGQTKIASGMAKRQLLVIQPQEVQQRRVEIMHVDAIGGDGDTVVVRNAVNDAAFDAAAGQPGGEDLVVMLASPGVRRLVVRAFVRTRSSRPRGSRRASRAASGRE